MINHESIKVVGCGTELLTRNLYHRVKPMVFSNSDGFCISGTTLPALSASASASASNKCGTMWIIFHPSLNNVYYSSVVLSDLEASTPPAEGWSTLVDGLLPSPKLEFMRDGTLEGHIKYKAMFNCPFLITSFPLVRTLSCGPREPLRERVVLKRKHRTCKTVKVEITTNDAGGELNTNECISPFQISYNISRCAPIVQEISTPMHPRVDLRILTSKNKQLRRQVNVILFIFVQNILYQLNCNYIFV